MDDLPGGPIAHRPLHFYWLCDSSGSMSLDGKIDSLNFAIRESLPHMRNAAAQNPTAKVYVQAMQFSHGARWLQKEPVSLEDFSWTDLTADPLQKASAEIIFLIDTSGSMGKEINAVRNSCLDFAARVQKEGVDVRLGLVGFAIGGYKGKNSSGVFKVQNLSVYTIGTWPLSSPLIFAANIQALKLRMFGANGCYLANEETVEIFPQVIRSFEHRQDSEKILVIISDQMGSTVGIRQIVQYLNDASIKTHVMGIPGHNSAHEEIARATGGTFWDITRSRGKQDFSTLLSIADTIAKEISKKLADGTISYGTDLGKALELTAAALKIPPMPSRALPPILLLVSDGKPSDNFDQGLSSLMKEPWGIKTIRLAIAIGKDADMAVLQQFIGRGEIKPLLANNPEALTRYIAWASTAAIKIASTPRSRVSNASGSLRAPEIPLPFLVETSSKIRW